MTRQTTDPTVEQPDSADDILQSREIQQKFAEIRTHLPGLQRLTAAFANLHELIDEDDLVADFDTWCRHEFGVVPELLLEATEHLATA